MINIMAEEKNIGKELVFRESFFFFQFSTLFEPNTENSKETYDSFKFYFALMMSSHIIILLIVVMYLLHG